MAEQQTFPRRFGRYILLDKVNTGGMAEVYRAKVSGTDNFQRIVAIKCMLPSLMEDKEFGTMFVDEARLAAQLNHGNIVQIYELGRHEEQLYIAMELVNGHDLRATTKRARKLGKRLGVGFVAYIVSKAAEALDYAHNKLSLEGTPLLLVHRDVSPQNILVSYDGEVKVVDFGIAKAAHRATETRAGTLKGKFAYMAPEQVVGEAIDRRADIFALGAILYEAATGRPLFYGDTDLAILEKVRTAQLPNLEEHLAHAPAQLCKVIRKARALKPEDRYQSALDMAEDLSPVLISRGNLFGPKNARTTMRVLYEKEWNAVPEKLKQYSAVDLAEESEGPARTQIFGVLLNTTGDVPLVRSDASPSQEPPPPASEAPTGEPKTDESPVFSSAATELFSPKELEARASQAEPAPTEKSSEPDASEERAEDVNPLGGETAAVDISSVRRDLGSADMKSDPPERVERSEKKSRPSRERRGSGSMLLDELRAAPRTVRYALLGLGLACVAILVALIVVLAGRGDSESNEPVSAAADEGAASTETPEPPAGGPTEGQDETPADEDGVEDSDPEPD